MRLYQTKQYNIKFVENNHCFYIDGVNLKEFYKQNNLDYNDDIYFEKDGNYILYKDVCYTGLSIENIIPLLFKENIVDVTSYYNDFRDIINSQKIDYKYQLEINDLLWFKNLTFKPYREVYNLDLDLQLLFNIDKSFKDYYFNLNKI